MEDQGPALPPGGRVVGLAFGICFAGVGLAVLGFMWAPHRDSFFEPPLFFKVFASFIAIPFVALGGSVALAAWRGTFPNRMTSMLRDRLPAARRAAEEKRARARSYTCPRCSAPLDGDAEVSPSGDVKCRYCNAWFNIHHEA